MSKAYDKQAPVKKPMTGRMDKVSSLCQSSFLYDVLCTCDITVHLETVYPVAACGFCR